MWRKPELPWKPAAKVEAPQELHGKVDEMTDFAEKARQGRLAALGALGRNGASASGLAAGNARFRADSRQDKVIFFTRRGQDAAACAPL